MSRDQIDEPRSPHLRLLRLDDDQEVRRDGHHLPHHEERQSGAGHDDERHRDDEQREDGMGDGGAARGREIRQAIRRAGQPHREDGDEKQRRERIDAKHPRPKRRRRVEPRGQRGRTEQHAHRGDDSRRTSDHYETSKYREPRAGDRGDPRQQDHHETEREQRHRPAPGRKSSATSRSTVATTYNNDRVTRGE